MGMGGGWEQAVHERAQRGGVLPHGRARDWFLLGKGDKGKGMTGPWADQIRA